MRIAVLANLKENAPIYAGMSPDKWDDLDSPRTVNGLVEALEKLGHQAQFFEARLMPPYSLIAKLQEYQPDLCFNIAEGHFGDAREAQIPALLEMLGFPYTGSKILTLALALDKPMTKRVLSYHGLPTPEFQVFEDANEPITDDLLNDDQSDLRFPLFVKPSREGTSVGISAESIVTTIDQLREQVSRQLAKYQQPVLVEHYIQGREMTVGVVGNFERTAARRVSERIVPLELPSTLHFFPVLEIATDEYPESEGGVYTNRAKVELADELHHYCPANIEPALENHLKLLTAAVFRVTGCYDVARVDFRLDAANNNQPYILEINPLPGLSPNYSDLCIQANAQGWEYDRLIGAILNSAMWRYGMIQSSGVSA